MGSRADLQSIAVRSQHLLSSAQATSQRAQRDAALKPEILRVHRSNCDGIYGAKKSWRQWRRKGVAAANCTVRRLIREESLSGARRGWQFKVTTVIDKNQRRPSDLVERQFVASAPNRLWVADLTYVKTHSS